MNHCLILRIDCKFISLFINGLWITYQVHPITHQLIAEFISQSLSDSNNWSTNELMNEYISVVVLLWRVSWQNAYLPTYWAIARRQAANGKTRREPLQPLLEASGNAGRAAATAATAIVAATATTATEACTLSSSGSGKINVRPRWSSTGSSQSTTQTCSVRARSCTERQPMWPGQFWF